MNGIYTRVVPGPDQLNEMLTLLAIVVLLVAVSSLAVRGWERRRKWDDDKEK